MRFSQSLFGAIAVALAFLTVVTSLPVRGDTAAQPSAKASAVDQMKVDTSTISAAEGTTAAAIRGATAAPPPPSRFTPFVLRGSLSPDSENPNGEHDPEFIPQALATPLAEVARLIPPPGQAYLADLPNAQLIATEAARRLGQDSIHVALLGQHKYMLADCLGAKVSVGEFILKLGSPTITITPTSVVASYSIDRISFSAFKLRFRPDVTDWNQPCHFSGRVELGGEADNVVIQLRYNPIVDVEHCTVSTPGPFDFNISIGYINLGPVPPGIADLENPFKDMTADAMNACFSVAEQMTGASSPIPSLLKKMTLSLNDVLLDLCHQAVGQVSKEATGAMTSVTSSAASSASSSAASTTAGAPNLNPPDGGRAMTPAPLEPPDGATTTASSASGPKPIGPVDGVVGSLPALPPDGATSAASGPKPVIPPNDVRQPYVLVANAGLKGRLGHIVIAFPDGAKVSNARIDSFKSDDATRIRTDYGNATIELLPGTYDLVINGRKITGIPVQSQHETRIHVGVLRLHGAKDTRFDLFEPGGKDKLATHYGETDVGLPAGDVEIMVNGQREKVTIENGAITDF